MRGLFGLSLVRTCAVSVPCGRGVCRRPARPKRGVRRMARLSADHAEGSASSRRPIRTAVGVRSVWMVFVAIRHAKRRGIPRVRAGIREGAVPCHRSPPAEAPVSGPLALSPGVRVNAESGAPVRLLELRRFRGCP